MDQLGSLHLHQPITILMQQLKCIPSQFFKKVIKNNDLWMSFKLQPKAVFIKSWINEKRPSKQILRPLVVLPCVAKGKQRKVIGAHWRILKKEEWEWVRDRSEKRPPPYLSIETFFSLSQCILQANKRARRRPSAPRTFYRHTDSSGH